MKKNSMRLLGFLLVAMMMVSLFGLGVFAGDTANDVNVVDGGDAVDAVDVQSSEADLLIGTADELKAFASAVNAGDSFVGKVVKLTADIDLYELGEEGEPVSFTPIGKVSETPFEGTFDGQGHTIKNLYQSGWAFGYEWGSYGSLGLFGNINDATVKNLTLKGAECLVEGGDVAGITGSATGTCVFENITITDSVFATYNNGCGSIIAWSGAGNYTFKNITIASDVTLAGLWGSFDSSIGGVVGQAEPGASYDFEDVYIACRVDAYNDCTASYDYYNYRMCGMIIGRLQETTTVDGRNYPDTSKYNITCTNVTVEYGNWMRYHYCEPTPSGMNGGRGMRVEAGYAYDGLPADYDHSQCTINHMNLIPFDQLLGGDQIGVKGLPTFEGVTVIYPSEVAQIGDVKYWTLADAIAAANAAENGATITLLADATVGEMMTIAKDVIIDGNRMTITWADGYNGTIFNVESGVSVTLKDLAIDGENSFTFYDDTTTVENGQNWYTRFVDVGEEDKAINDNVIVNAGNLTLDSVRITGVTIASDGPSGKTENTESGYVLMYNDDLALIKSNGGKVTINGGAIMYNAGMVLNAINAETSLNTNVMYNMGAGNKGGIIVANGGTMDVKGVITYNKAMARSATILGVINGAEVTFDAVMNYNEHIGVGSNTAGAMIVLEGASQFVMNGGTINYNEGGRAGAIASRWVGGNFGQHADTSIVLNAGSIIGNTASNDSWNGASIFLRSPAAIGEGMTIDGTIAVNAAPGALEITGGTFNNFDMIVTDGLTAEITGGTFDSDPAEWVADSYATVYSDGYYTVKPVIAEIFFSAFGGGETSVTYPGYANSLQELVDYYMLCNNANETAIPGFSAGDYTPVLVIYGDLSAEDVAYLGGASTDGTYVSAKPMTWTVRFADGVDADENVKAAEGYVKVDNGDGTFTVQKAVAQVGDTYFATLQDAFAACTNGETITLLVDLVYDADDAVPAHGGATGFGNYDQYNPSIIYIGGTKGATEAENQPSNVNAVLDLNGHTITNNADAYLFLFMDNCKVTIKDSKDGDGIIGNTEAPVIWVTGTDTLITIESGKYTTVNAEGLLWSTHGGDLVIKGGEFSTSAEDASLLIIRNAQDRRNPNYFIDGKATVTIYGGTFYGFDPEKMMDDSTDPFTEFDACADGYKSIKSGNAYTVENYIEWIKQQLLLGNDVVLEKDIVVDGSMIESIPAPTNGNGKYPNYGIFNVVGDYDVTFDLNGHSITYNGHKDFEWNGKTYNSCTVAHGLFFANDGAHLTIVGEGDVIVNGVASGVYSASPDTAITIQGGNWVNNVCAECGATNLFLYASHGGELYIEGGYFEQALDAEGESYLIVNHGGAYANSVIDYSKTKVVISGGTFVGMDPANIKYFEQTADNKLVTGATTNGCAEGYESIDNGDGTYSVIPTKLALVEVEIMPGFWGTSYITVENWADLVAALGANTNLPVKVTLLENIKLTDEVLTIAGTAKKVIDLNGKRITGTFTEETTAFVYVTGGCELTILDSTVTEVDGFTAGGIHAINTNGNLSNLIRVDADSKMVIESGSYSQDASVNGAGMIDSRGDEIITIKGGHFRLYNIGSAENGSPWILNASSQNTKNIIVLGGTYNADIIHQYYPFEVMAPKELALVQGEDGIWHFVPAVAYVNEQEWSSNWYTNEVGYATLEDAIAAVEGIRTKDGKTSAEEFITLLADAVVTGNVDTKGITIEQNGFAIKLAAGATLTAPAGLNVTTDVANRKVVYENGVYKLAVITYAAQIGDTLYETIQDAVYAAQNGDTIIVLVDHEMNCADAVANSSGYAVLVNVANQAVTIDLNGKVITVNVDQNAEIYGIFATDTNGKLTLMDSSADKTGKVEITAPGYLYSVLFAYGADSKLTVNGGRYVADAVADSLIYSQYNEIVEINDGYFYLGNVGTGSNGKPWIFNAKGQNTAHAIVKGGIFNADIIHQFYPFEVSVPKELALVQGVGGIWYFVPAVAYVNEQEWSSNWYTNEVGYATFEQAIAAVEGIRTKNGKTSAEEFITLLGDVMVTGNVDTKGITIVQNGFAIRLGIADATLTAVEGLNVTTDLAGYKVVYENGTYKVAKNYVAQIGDDLYTSIQDAIDAAEDGDEVVVLENVELGWNDTVNAADGKAVLLHVEGKNIILNLNGKTITVEHMATEVADRIYAVVLVADGAGLTVIGNGTIDVTANETTPRVAYLFWKRGTTGYLVVENGTYHMNHTEDSMIYTNGDEIITIKGGSFTLDSVGTSTNGSPWIFNAQGTGGKSILITGGTFNADINRQHWSDEAVVDKTCYVVNNGDGTWTVMAGAAAHVLEGMLTGPYYAPKEIGYATIEEAIAAAIAKKDNPITLLTDFVLTAPIDAADKTIVQNGFAIKLAIADATLTAVEGLNVTTDVANRKVVYEDGVYKLAVLTYVAQIGDVKYETLQDAIDKAEPGDTITLLADVSEDVTINESITLDGALFEYTGNITVQGNNNDISVVIKKVNFGNGTGYAVTTSRIKSITIEDCTVTGRAFLYAKHSTPSIVVKNVTVSGGNYVANITYGSEAYFENVTAIGMTGYGIYTQSHSSKNITLKNCSFDTPNYPSIAVKDVNTAAVDTFIFEGDNVMTSLRENEHTKYVLGAADATLTAPEGYTVTTDVAGCKVVYKDGAYKVEKAAVYNETTGKSFDTIAEAMLDARNNGVDNDVIVLQRDLEESVVIIYNGTTLNLKSFTLTADYVVSFNGGKLTGDPNSAAGVGAKLAVPDKQFVALAEDAYFDGSASILPVWDKNQNAFVFSKFIISLTGGFDVTDDNSIFMTQFKVLATGYVNQNILVSNGVGDQASTGIHVEVSASWTKEGDNGDITTQTYRFSDESMALAIIKDANGNTHDYIASITTAGLQNLTMTIRVVSDTGIVLSSQTVSADSLMN